jgi:hypothetical protein
MQVIVFIQEFLDSSKQAKPSNFSFSSRPQFRFGQVDFPVGRRMKILVLEWRIELGVTL